MYKYNLFKDCISAWFYVLMIELLFLMTNVFLQNPVPQNVFICCL